MIAEIRPAERERPRAAGAHAVLTTGLAPLRWLTTAIAMATAVVIEGARPLTWRRPVRAELLRFVDLAGVRSLPAVTVMAILVGVSIVAQALFWLEEIGGEVAVVRDIISSITIREVAPLVVGLIVLGRGGLTILAELGRMGREGQIRALDAQGLDPFLVLVVPRVLALALSMFCLTLIFILVAFAAGYLGANAAGVSTTPAIAFVGATLATIGSEGALMLPLKTLGIGFAIGIVCCLTALEQRARHEEGHELLARGFLRAALAVFLVSALVTLLLTAAP